MSDKVQAYNDFGVEFDQESKYLSTYIVHPSTNTTIKNRTMCDFD